MSAWQVLIVIGLCVAAEGFFSGSEIAVVSSDKFKARQRAQAGHWGARMLDRWMKKPEQVLSTTLIGTNLFEISATVIATMYLVSVYGGRGEIYALLIMAPVILLGGEIIPKTVYQHYADRLAPVVILILRAFYFAIYPVSHGLAKLIEAVVQAVGTEPKNPFVIREELATVARLSVPESSLEVNEKRLISKIFSFSDTTVEEVMVPLIDLVAMNQVASLDEAARRVDEFGFSRLPVFVNRVYNIVGAIHALDLLTAPPGAALASLMRPVNYVPKTMPVSILLRQMQRTQLSMVVVVDEYGAAVGIVTVEDVLEEIVGEIHDEFDTTHVLYERCEDGSLLCDARLEIDTIREELGIELPKGDYETLAGFLIEHFRRIAKTGDTIQAAGYELRVEVATERTVTKVRLTPSRLVSSSSSPRGGGAAA